MKTLIQKELRENLRLAANGLLMAIAVVVGTQLYYIDLIKGVSTGISLPQNYSYRLQPLTSENFETFSWVLCAVVGFMLGWFQVHSERHRDLWAFLVHRPVTRTVLFFGKIIAGLILYLLAVGLPLLYFVWWVKTSGHVAAPFDWRMTATLAVGIFSGVAWYFAGMLTSIREARWYGSRGLGLAAAMVETIAAVSGEKKLMLLITAALALAVWGAFYNRGRFRGQPVVGKAALTFSLALGAGSVGLGGFALIVESMLGAHGMTVWPHYEMSPEGIIHKVTQPDGMPPQILTLDGRPLLDPDTGKPMELDKFNRASGTVTMRAVVGGAFTDRSGRSVWFQYIRGNNHTLWFKWNPTGRILEYDAASRRFVGSVGPGGFATTINGDGSGFLAHSSWQDFAWHSGSALTIASSNTIYEIDLEKHSIKALWTVPDNDEIRAWANNRPGENTLVVTRREILLLSNLTDTGKPLWSLPFTYSATDYPSVTVYSIEPKKGRAAYAVWISPSFTAFWQDKSQLPIHAVWLSENGKIAQQMDLPALLMPDRLGTAEFINEAGLPPAFVLARPWLSNRSPRLDWSAFRLALGPSVVCVILGLWLGRCASFSAKRQVIWAAFHLFFGVPGLLAFISVQEWPARVRCTTCGKLRIVQNDACEHCGGAFSPPAKNGTEIFEALETA